MYTHFIYINIFIYIYIFICAVFCCLQKNPTDWLLPVSNQLLLNQTDSKWDERDRSRFFLQLWIVLLSASQPERLNTATLCLIFFLTQKVDVNPLFYFTVLCVFIMIFLCNGNFNFSTSLFPFLQFMQIQLSYKCYHRLMHALCQHWPWLCGIWKVVVSEYSHIGEWLGGKNVLIKTKLDLLFKRF